MTEHNQRKKKRLAASLLTLAIVSALCMLVIAGVWWLSKLPAYAEQKFGPASENLSPFQRILMPIRLIQQSDTLTQPLDPSSSDIPFEVTLGEPPISIATRLEQLSLISDAQAFLDFLVYSGLDTTLQAGDYVLSARLTPIEIARSLQDSTPAEVTFSILPGWRLEEIAETLPTTGLEFTKEEFLSGVAAPPPLHTLSQEISAGSSLEGFMFPGSYIVNRDISQQGLIQIVMDQFLEQVNQELINGFNKQGLNLYQAVTLASIIQREAVVAGEMPMIASVFLNRLNSGMRLDADPTVQYSIGFNEEQNTWWTNPLSLTDLQIDSPYNTYVYAGLPPGPISNPGFEALKAVAFPAQTPYYYFRAACDGSGKHTFSETLEQHTQNACP